VGRRGVLTSAWHIAKCLESKSTELTYRDILVMQTVAGSYKVYVCLMKSCEWAAPPGGTKLTRNGERV
jgi:hypothetical protein